MDPTSRPPEINAYAPPRATVEALARRGVPRTARGTLTPWRAVYSLFIPFYNTYFVVAMNVALCDTLNAILESARSERRAPRALAIAASVTWLSTLVLGFVVSAAHLGGPYAVWAISAVAAPISGALWFAYMLVCDRAREAVAQLGAEPSALGAPRLSRIQRKEGPQPVAAIVVSLVAMMMVLACWQLLQPTELGAPR